MGVAIHAWHGPNTDLHAVGKLRDMPPRLMLMSAVVIAAGR